MVEARARPGFVVGRRLLTSSHARRFHEVVVCSPLDIGTSAAQSLVTRD